jgi:ubiquitin-conjugating enzyme E2 D/E
MHSRRLANELKAYKARFNAEGANKRFVLAETESEREWKGYMFGPPSSPYSGAEFYFTITFGERYPFTPFQFAFSTPIFHHRVSVKDGTLLCLASIHDEWSPAFTVDRILNKIYTWLEDPSLTEIPDEQCHTVICSFSPTEELYQVNRYKYFETARLWTTYRYIIGALVRLSHSSKDPESLAQLLFDKCEKDADLACRYITGVHTHPVSQLENFQPGFNGQTAFIQHLSKVRILKAICSARVIHHHRMEKRSPLTQFPSDLAMILGQMLG